jgi:hypothetical protein
MRNHDEEAIDLEAARRGALYAGQDLASTDWLESDNGLFRAGFESNGNFAVWSYSTNPIQRKLLWGGMADHPVVGSHLHMNPAGRIELISPTGDRLGVRGCIPISNTYPCERNRNPFCVMQDDGNFVVYTHTPAGVKAIWATDTWRANSQWRDLTIPGVVRIDLEGGSISPYLSKTLVNSTGERLVVVDETQIMTVAPAGTVAISTSSNSVKVTATSYNYNGDFGSDDSRPAIDRSYGPGQNVITISQSSSALSLT